MKCQNVNKRIERLRCLVKNLTNKIEQNQQNQKSVETERKRSKLEIEKLLVIAMGPK